MDNYQRSYTVSNNKYMKRGNQERYHRNNYRNEENHYNNSRYSNSDCESEKFIIHINSDKVGKLIGRSGANIKDLQSKTNTKIHVIINILFVYFSTTLKNGYLTIQLKIILFRLIGQLVMILLL